MVDRLYILSADDDPDDQFIIKQALKELGLNVNIDFVEDGVTFVNKLIDHCMLKCPDLIMLDVNMPKMNGFEALKKVKEHEVTKDVPVVVLTTADMHDFHDQCKKMGADLCLTKPASYSEFVTIIKNIVQNHLLSNS